MNLCGSPYSGHEVWSCRHIDCYTEFGLFMRFQVFAGAVRMADMCFAKTTCLAASSLHVVGQGGVFAVQSKLMAGSLWTILEAYACNDGVVARGPFLWILVSIWVAYQT